MESVEKVTNQRPKNPGRVEAGKRLAKLNKERKEKLLENSKVEDKTLEAEKTSYISYISYILPYMKWGAGFCCIYKVGKICYTKFFSQTVKPPVKIEEKKIEEKKIEELSVF